jgi:hypothetical protein
MSAVPPTAPPPRLRGGRRDEDTAAGCRAKAAADLARAGVPGTDPMRWRMEHSAAAWTARADLLERQEKAFEARMTGAAPVPMRSGVPDRPE